MRDHRMHRVVEILDEQFPVALVQVAQRAADHLEPAGGRAVRHVVDGREGLAEIILKARTPRAQPHEYESPMLRDTGHAGQIRDAAGDSSKPLPA